MTLIWLKLMLLVLKSVDWVTVDDIMYIRIYCQTGVRPVQILGRANQFALRISY
jgi:hypothetical protein